MKNSCIHAEKLDWMIFEQKKFKGLNFIALQASARPTNPAWSYWSCCLRICSFLIMEVFEGKAFTVREFLAMLLHVADASVRENVVTTLLRVS